MSGLHAAEDMVFLLGNQVTAGFNLGNVLDSLKPNLPPGVYCKRIVSESRGPILEPHGSLSSTNRQLNSLLLLPREDGDVPSCPTFWRSRTGKCRDQESW